MDRFADQHFVLPAFLLAVGVYGLSTLYAVFLWRRGFRRSDQVNYFLLLAGSLLHTTAMVQRGLSQRQCPVGTLFDATAFVAWTIVAVCLVVGALPRLRFLAAFASPVLLGLTTFALVLPTRAAVLGSQAEFSEIRTSLHAALTLLAYGAFGLSAVAALMYLMQEHDLKFRKVRAVVSVLPPIQRLERIAGGLLLGGFVFLTLGLAAGGYDLFKLHNAQAHRGDLKIIWSVLVWLLYLGLVLMRWKFAQGGRRFALGTVGTFAFVLLTFWGVNLLSPLHSP